MLIVLVDEEYWRSIINFGALIEAGMIERSDHDLFGFASTAEGPGTCSWLSVSCCPDGP